MDETMSAGPFENPSLFLAFCSLPLITYLFFAARTHFVKTKRSNLPPGPPGLPLLGNLLELPSKELWIAATRWAKSYGEPAIQ